MRLLPVSLGVLLMLVGSYLDNLRGPLMPVLTRALGLGYTQVSWMLVAGFASAIVFTVGMREMLARHSDRKFTLWILFVAFGAAAFSMGVKGLGSMLFFGAFLGVSITGFGSAANLLVLENTPDARKARMMCLLHSMYGIGSLIGPMTLGFVVGRGHPWQAAFLGVLPVLLLLGLGSIKLHSEVHGGGKTARAKLGGHAWLGVLVMAAYAGGEVLLSTWMVPYLVEAKGLSMTEAGTYASAFFLMMGMSRILSGFSLKPEAETAFLVGGLGVAMGFFILGRVGPIWALSLAGVFGPVFPVMLARLGKAFPDKARSIVIVILGVMQVTLASLHLLVGRLTDLVGIGTAYWLPLGFLGVAFFALLLYLRRERALLS